MTERNYLDRIGNEDEPATLEDVAGAMKALRPWRVDIDYPGYLSVYPEDVDGPVFAVGTANETWGGDFYPSGHAQEEGEVYVGFDTGIDDTVTDASEVGLAIVAEVELYMKRRPVRGEFLEALRDLRVAMHTVNTAWGKLDAEDSSALVDNYPFPHSFDEMVGKVDEWITQARRALNDEYQEHPCDQSFASEPVQARKGQ